MAATRWALRAHAGCGTEAVAVSAPAVAAPDDAEAPEIEPDGVAVAAGSAEEDSPPDPPQPARTRRTAHAAAARTSCTPRRTRVAKWPGGPSALFPLGTTAVGGPLDPDPIDLAT